MSAIKLNLSYCSYTSYNFYRLPPLRLSESFQELENKTSLIIFQHPSSIAYRKLYRPITAITKILSSITKHHIIDLSKFNFCIFHAFTLIIPIPIINTWITLFHNTPCVVPFTGKASLLPALASRKYWVPNVNGWVSPVHYVHSIDSRGFTHGNLCEEVQPFTTIFVECPTKLQQRPLLKDLEVSQGKQGPKGADLTGGSPSMISMSSRPVD